MLCTLPVDVCVSGVRGSISAMIGFCAPIAVSASSPAISSTRASAWVYGNSRGMAPARTARWRAATIVAADTALNLPPDLSKLVDSFAAVPDAKLRYQQLLFFARKLPEMDNALKTDYNRVRGCTSVVHVDVKLDEKNKVRIAADSDAQLTKGLIALLVNGLNGCTVEEVLAVDPAFINATGLSMSLTPSRNNGFLNMVAKIKDLTKALGDAARSGRDEPAEKVSSPVGGGDIAGRPMYSSILRKMQILKPTDLFLKDNSAAHANHSTAKGLKVRKDGSASEASGKTLSPESHFALTVVSDAFEGLSLVKRHKIVYTLLREEMQDVHALNIKTMTTAESLGKTGSKK
jgi:BolA-like protein 1